MKTKNNLTGHLFALFSVIVWGTTFISTKVLLKDFTPIEILFFRFLIGVVALLIAVPKRLKGTTKKQELLFAGAGLCGVTLYFLLENIALTYTMASNVGVIISVAPFFTAIVAHFILDGEKQKPSFFLGFVSAILGIFLISFNGSVALQLNPVGDILAILAALVWAFYSIFTKKIGSFGLNTVQTTRRVFSYGLLFMLPALFFFDFKLGLERFANPINLFNIVFLGLLASAICFATWNFALKTLGAVKTSVYIYMVPVITVITSVIILREKITLMAVVGMFFTLLGLFISEGRFGGFLKSKS